MKQQHEKIKGYRTLTDSEINLMNSCKTLGSELENIISVLRSEEETDKRWIDIAETDLQKGIMGLVRSIAKPESF